MHGLYIGTPESAWAEAAALSSQVHIRWHAQPYRQVLAVLPHGTGTCEVVEGGLEIPNAAGTGSTVMATAAAVVWLDLPDDAAMGETV